MMLCVCLFTFLGAGYVVGLFDQRCCGLGFVRDLFSKIKFNSKEFLQLKSM